MIAKRARNMLPNSFYILRELIFLSYFCEGYGVVVFVAGDGDDDDDVTWCRDDVTWFRDDVTWCCGVVTLDCAMFSLISDEHLPRDIPFRSKCLSFSQIRQSITSRDKL